MVHHNNGVSKLPNENLENIFSLSSLRKLIFFIYKKEREREEKVERKEDNPSIRSNISVN